MRIWDISQIVRPDMPVWPGEPPVRVMRNVEIGDGCPVNVGEIDAPLHAGTHADAPLHYAPDGAASADCDLAPYIGRCVLIDVRHAAARTIIVELHHGTDRLSLAIIDDGIGLSAAVLAAGSRQGHYGMVGMRERAQRMDGAVEIISTTRTGTTIRVTVPARVAYL